jgi:hypothetical protein
MPSEKLRAQKKLKFYNIEKKLFDFINGYEKPFKLKNSNFDALY